MEKLRYYMVDAFAEHAFEGGPTGVCILNEWFDDSLLLQIASENCLPETAYVIKRQNDYHIRWFAPNSEVDLCGHATLGTAFVIFNFLEPRRENIHFQSLSGPLDVDKKDDLYVMDLPSRIPNPTGLTSQMVDALGGIVPKETYSSRDLFFLLENEKQVKELKPNFEVMSQIEYGDGVIVTAEGEKSDFVTRAFFPKLLTNEDPVCGSAHCNLTPFWSEKLHKSKMISKQLSPRGATIYCELNGDRVKIGGKVTLYSIGEIYIPI